MPPVPPRRCAVIGAGVLGASVAARLAAAGMDVTVLEGDRPGRATSRWSFAWLNSNDKAPRSYHDLNHARWASGPSWRLSWTARPGTYQAGHVELAASEAGRAELAARVQRLTEWGYPARLIDAAEAVTIEPALRLSWPQAAAAWFPEEAYVLTEPLIERLIGRAQACGATVLTGERGRVTSRPWPGAHRRRPGPRRGRDRVLRRALDHAGSGPGRPVRRGAAGARWSPGIPPVPPPPGLVVRAGPVAPDGPAHVDSHAAAGPASPRPAAWCTWRPPTPRSTCIRPVPSSSVGRASSCTAPAAPSAASSRRPSPTIRSASGRCRWTASRSSAACPAPGGSTSPSPTAASPWPPALLPGLIAAELAAGEPAAELAPYRPDRFTGTAIRTF